MRKLISRFLTAALVASVCWIFPDATIFATIATPATSAVDCRMAANPDECLIQQNQAKEQDFNINNIIPLNTDALGLSGPFSASVKYDDDLGLILGLGYLQMLNEYVGVAVKLALGTNELRGNLTLGFEPFPNHQLKITYESLYQNLPFDFESGTVNEWVGQNALGGAYQYILNKSIAHSLEVSGSYIKAGSKHLPDIIFYDDEDYTYYNLRRIAGGTQGTLQGSINLLPFKNTMLGLGAGYSSITYDNQNEAVESNTTIAYKAELTHLPTLKTKLIAAINNTASSRELSAKVSQILPKKFEVFVKGQHNQGYGAQPSASSVMLGVSYPAPKAYSLKGLNKFQELKNWIDKPVVQEARVLAIKDEAIKKVEIAAAVIIPDQTHKEGGSITPVDTSTYFSFDAAAYDEVTYTFTATPLNESLAAEPPANAKLNLAIQQINSYQATLYSKEPLPEGSAGQYKITLTAVGTKADLKQPVVQTSSFTLTVLASGPAWTKKGLPPANMGVAYAPVDLNDGYVVTDVPDDSLTFTLVSGPEWLMVKDGHLLTANNNQIVPQNIIQAPNVSLRVRTSENEVSQKTFVLGIDQSWPMWNSSSNYQWSMQYDDTSNGIALNPFITSGQSSLSFTFSNNETSNGNWVIANVNGNFFLRRASVQQSDIGDNVELTLVAHNNTSSIENQIQHSTQVVKVQVQSDQNLPAPVWNTTTLNATAGQASFSIPLAPLVNGSVSNDSYTFQLNTDSQSSWLTLSADGQSLIATNVPPVGDTASGAVEFTLNATSKSSGKQTGNTNFTLNVQNLIPVWVNPIPETAVTIPFNATVDNTQATGILLNTLVTTNKSGLTFSFTQNKDDFSNSTWQIVQQGSDFYLKLVAPLNDYNTSPPPPVTVYAFNTTSNAPVQQSIPVKVVPDSSLPGPVWNETTISTATAGTPKGQYIYSLNELFTCAANDTCIIETNATEVLNWLELAPPPLSASNNVNLVNQATIPAASTDPQGQSNPFWIKITSVDSGKSIIRNNFTIPISNTLPVWVNQPAVNVPFDGSGAATAIDLNTYITSDTSSGLSFALADSSYAQNWQVVNSSGHYYLQRTSNASTNDIGTSVSIPVKALNSTSANGAVGNVKVNVTTDTALPAPQWLSTSLPSANMGFPYSTVNLAEIVKPSSSNDTLTFSFVDETPPSWLAIQACTVSGQASTCLVPVGNIPTTAGTNFTISIQASSKASGQSSKQTFTTDIQQTPVSWINDPQGNVEFNDSTNGIELDSFVNSGQGNPQGDAPILSFDTAEKGWTISQNNGKSFLVMTSSNPIFNNVDAIGTTVPVVVTARNNTSSSSVNTSIKITVIADSGVPAPAWNSAVPQDTTAQAQNYEINYCKFIDDGSCSNNSQYKFTVGPITYTDIDGQSNWLQNNGQQLNAESVPTANIDPPNSGVVSFTLQVQNLSTGLVSTVKQFSFKVNNIVPVWAANPTSIANPENNQNYQNYNAWTMPFDADANSGHSVGITMNPLVSLNASPDLNNIRLGFDTTAQQTTSGNWALVKDSGNNQWYLRRNSNSTDLTSDFNQPTTLTIYAYNPNTQAATGSGILQSITITPIADERLAPPSWNSTTLPNANMGFSYETDLTSLVTPSWPNGDILQFNIESTNFQSFLIAPCSTNATHSCLKSDGVIPTSAPGPLNVTIAVVSETSEGQAIQPFAVTVVQAQPIWLTSTDPITMEFDSSDKIYLPVQNDLNLNIATNPNDAGQNFVSSYWKIANDNDGKGFYLQRTAAGQWTDTTQPFPSDAGQTVKVPLQASNSTSANAVPNEITVNVTVPAFNWSNNSINQTVQASQDLEISSLNSLSLISGGIQGDTYTFSIVGDGQIKNGGQCVITASSTGNLDKLTCNNVQATDIVNGSGAFQLTLQAQSNTTKTFASSNKQFAIVVQPSLVNGNNKVSLKFDDVNKGLSLNDQSITDTAVITNPNNLPIACALITVSNNWQLDNNDQKNCIVKRKLNASNQIDASDVNQSNALNVNITYGSNLSNNNAVLNTGLAATATPDEALTYKYSNSNISGSLAISALDPFIENVDQTGDDLPLKLAPGTYVKAFTPVAVGGVYEVIGDSNYEFSKPDASQPQPKYVDYTAVTDTSNPRINFYWAQLSELGQGWGGSPMLWQLNVKSTANNNHLAEVSNLPGISVRTLTLTPPNSTTTPSNGVLPPTASGNMVYGGFNTGGGACSSTYNFGYLQLNNLPTKAAPLVVKNIAVVYPQGISGQSQTKWPTVCSGSVNPSTNLNPGKCPSGSVVSSYTDSESIIPDGNGNVTFLPTINCVNNTAKNFSIFNDGTTQNQSIRLELQ